MEESIEGMAKALRLQNARRHYRELVDEALAAGLGYEQFLRLVFERECESRSAKAVEKKIRSARFPCIKTFDEMDWSAFSVPVARTIRELQSLSFAREGRNVVLIGNPGTGKTHTAIALGMLACQRGMSVLYASVPNLVLELKEAMGERQLVSYKKRFMSYDLVILDELGYISFDKEGSELLFNLLSNRSERKSMVFTTNLPFDKWAPLFGDTMMAAAMIDRIANKANVIQIIGDSYRLKQTQEWMRKGS